MNQTQVTIQLHCQNLPGKQFDGKTGVRLGIQKGDTVIEDILADAPRVIFTVTLNASASSTTGNPNFTGPFAQGTPSNRFIYLCWGERNHGIWEGFRRAKIQLQPLTQETVDTAIRTGQPIKAIIDMTDNKGAPLCASVKEDKIRWEL